MNFILAPDSFKESMTAKEACEAMEAGIRKILPQAICRHIPLADGGEGTMQALADATGGKIYQLKVAGPLGKETTGQYAILGDNETGVVELASASGLHLVSREDRNPGITSTFGTGQLIEAALRQDIKRLVIGLGGSATNDGGAGLMQALGVKFLNKTGQEITPVGNNLYQIEEIDTSALITRQKQIKIEVACDVTNPLTGKEGASAVYGPQKGATPDMVTTLDEGLRHYAEKIRQYLGKDVEFVPGAGAAGGAGAGLMAFLDARLVKGIDLVLKYSGLEEKIKEADYIFTGEGSIDSQTVYGKTISGVTQLARLHHKPVIAFAGKVTDVDALYKMGLTSVMPIVPYIQSLEQALQNGRQNLAQAAASVVSLINYERNIHNKPDLT